MSQEYLSFLSYGRVVFRLCVSALLFTSSRVRDAGLAEKLITNQQRLQEICRILSDESMAPLDRFVAARSRIVAVANYRWASETGLRLETLIGVVKAAARALLAANLEISPDVSIALRAAADAKRTKDHFEELTAIHDLEHASRVALWRVQPAEEPVGLTWALIDAVHHYTGMHYIQLRYNRPEEKASDLEGGLRSEPG